MSKLTVAAVDIGASSGRVLTVQFDGKRLTTDETHRFPNNPVTVRGTLHWDILRLWHEVQAGIGKVEHPAAIGLDTWGVDFALLDQSGRLLANPVHYRDHRTNGMLEEVFAKVPRAEVFSQTGIQTMPINTLYQLASMVKAHDPIFSQAARFLTIPDLLYYWLTGTLVNEYTNATTTQCFDVCKGDWAFDLLQKLEIPTHIFSPVTQPGQILGKFEDIPVVLTPHHDTASAVIGVPASADQIAYLSSGTWSLLGLELPAPVVTDAALAANVTNEGGYARTTRFLKNVMGLWLLQESRRAWFAVGESYTYDELLARAAESAPFRSLIDPDDPVFLPAGDMPTRIREYCQRTNQPIPQSIGEIVRCILESLALKYRYVLDLLTGLADHPVTALHVVGGGSQNALLCQMTADATGIPVVAGPAEATALGNAVVQLIALGEVKSVAEGRALIAESSALVTYEPRSTEVWKAAFEKFKQLLET